MNFDEFKAATSSHLNSQELADATTTQNPIKIRRFADSPLLIIDYRFEERRERLTYLIVRSIETSKMFEFQGLALSRVELA